jgi:hypothetical protein
LDWERESLKEMQSDLELVDVYPRFNGVKKVPYTYHNSKADYDEGRG